PRWRPSARRRSPASADSLLGVDRLGYFAFALRLSPIISDRPEPLANRWLGLPAWLVDAVPITALQVTQLKLTQLASSQLGNNAGSRLKCCGRASSLIGSIPKRRTRRVMRTASLRATVLEYRTFFERPTARSTERMPASRRTLSFRVGEWWFCCSG